MKDDSNVRKTFREYFVGKNGHTWFDSMPVIPKDDPTMLFTTAGMVQFKKQLLGESGKLKSAASIQKCIRTSDIEEVGKTARHLTFFEMYGNFSFGDYFKQEAIDFAWGFLVDILSIDKSRLYATVYQDDDEAFELWKKYLDESRIVRLGEKDNFWKMGDTGPCGPCSEIIYDQGSGKGCGSDDCFVGCDCDRYLEVWNLVFTQFDRQADGTLNDLPKKNIDTGMGLERLNQVLGKHDNVYETPTIAPLVEHVSSTAANKIEESLRIVSDHSRSIVFMIADGVSPSNEGRGYVLRRLIRRASREGRKLGWIRPMLAEIADKVISLMSGSYPELNDRQEHIISVCSIEEKSFLQTLDSATRVLESYVEGLSPGAQLPADKAFKLYDTYGLPVEIAESILKDRDITVDVEGFNKLLEERAMNTQWHDKSSGKSYWDEVKDIEATEFTGYSSDCVSTAVLKVASDNKAVVLQKTPMYAESGGQVGDSGFISGPGASFKVEDTQKEESVIIHKGYFESGTFNEGDEVDAVVDKVRRRNIERNHTATHILQSVLREVLGTSVQQNGSLVEDDKLRFDFTYPKAVTKEELSLIEKKANAVVIEDIEIDNKLMDIDEARAAGALAFFGDKYGDEVRTVTLTDNEGNRKSMELCGGTHLKRTGQIGYIKIISETGIAAGIRRIEAITGPASASYIRKMERTLDELALLMNSPVDKLPEKLNKIIKESKEKDRHIDDLQNKLTSSSSLSGEKTALSSVPGVSVIINRFDDADINLMRSWVDNNNIYSDDGKTESLLAFAISKNEEKLVFIFKVPDQLTDKIDAGRIVKEISSFYKGGGGGRKNMAQGGGMSSDPIDKIEGKILEIIDTSARSSAG